jgi:uncharacterized protein YdaU (DUF1376 family)
MNFYKRFVADIQVKTGHLTPAEFGVYDRLLDHYYATEAPLPASLDRCSAIARAMTKPDQQAVGRVLAEFFTLDADGYRQRRADEMIAEAQPKILAARTNGKRGGRPKGTHQEPTGLSDETHGEPDAKASQSQSLLPTVEVRDPPTSGLPVTTLRAVPAPPSAFDGSNGEGVDKKALVQLSTTFDLPEEWGVDAEALGFPRSKVLFESTQFRFFWSKGKGQGRRKTLRGWRQAWSNWLGKAAERAA